MSYTLSVDPHLRLGMACMSGKVTGTEIAKACIDLYSDANWQPGFDELWDMSSIRGVDVSPEEMNAIVQNERDTIDHVGTGRVALVVTDDVLQMIGALYRRLVASLGRPVEVVETLEEGATWLGLDSVPDWSRNAERGQE